MPPLSCSPVLEFLGKSDLLLSYALCKKGLQGSDIGGQIQVVANTMLCGLHADTSQEVRKQVLQLLCLSVVSS